MHKIFLLITTFILCQSAFAQDMPPNSKACDDVAKACLVAGYSESQNTDKRFWIDCMKPLLLGHAINGVNIDPATVKTCRADKIYDLKKELSEFESITN